VLEFLVLAWSGGGIVRAEAAPVPSTYVTTTTTGTALSSSPWTNIQYRASCPAMDVDRAMRIPDYGSTKGGTTTRANERLLRMALSRHPKSRHYEIGTQDIQ